MNNYLRTCTFVTLAGLALLPVACESTPKETPAEKRASMTEDVKNTIEAFKKKDARAAKGFETAHGYAVFPRVVKAGVVLAGFGGPGEVYQGGKLTGTSDLSGGSLGATIGGQDYAEVVFFEDARAYKRFTQGTFALAAGASAVAGSKGGATAINYKDGVAVFVIDPSGAMVDASVGGQNFSFKPVK